MAQFNIIELEQVILALQSPDPLIIRLPVYNDNTAIDIVSYDLKMTKHVHIIMKRNYVF
jgi:hypothetical protein